MSVSTTPSGVRFIAPGAVSIRLEVYDPSGATVFDSEFRDGNMSLGTNSPARKLHISDAMRLQPIANPPASPASGDLYFDTSEALFVFVGGAWAKLAGPGTCN